MVTLLKKYLSFKKTTVFVGAVLGLFLLMASPAYAGVGVGVAPDFPASVTVGQTNVAVGLEITNNSTPDVGSVDLSNIRLIPSCGDSDADTTTCAGAEVDPGVFTVSAAGTGANACAGINFTTSVNDVTTGQVLFTPSATVTLDQGETCRINFTVNVNQAPVDDASGSAGLQTLQISRVSATQTGNGLSGTGLGTDETTVVPQGHIIVDKVTDPSGDDQSFSFDGSGGSYGDFSLTDEDAPNDQILAPGAYSISETVPTGWDLTSATCISSIQDIETPASLELDAGETITCTFNNQKDSKIIVDKVTAPADSEVQFDFTTTYGSPFMLTDDSTPNDSGDIDPGEYDVTEGSESGWTNTSISCVSSTGDATDTDGQDLDLDAGEIITCTFTNTQQTGNIIVDKVTNPADDPTEFDFDPSWSASNFSLTDDDTPEDSGPLSVGQYSVSELAETGWDSDDGVCDSTDEADTSTPGDIDLDAGETITCTFTNTREMGHIIVDKVTDPSGDTTSFSFDATGDGYDDFSLTDAATPNDQELVTGTYSVSETLPANWEQTSATCVSSLEDDETIDNLELDAGETITCTFTNTMDVVQWCSPGYWKNHLDEAAEAAAAGGFSLSDPYSEHFPALTLSKKAIKDQAPANPTLQQVLENPQWYGGGPANNVGDLLSEAHPDVDFDEGDARVENCPLN